MNAAPPGLNAQGILLQNETLQQLMQNAGANAQQLAGAAQGNAPAGLNLGVVLRRIAEEKEAEDLRKVQTNVLKMLENQLSGRQTVPQRNLLQGAGINLTQPGAIPQAAPQIPLPWDESVATEKNLMGVVAMLPPDLLMQNTQALGLYQQATPEMILALTQSRQAGIYTGVPDNFLTNRLNILRQRTRENSVYAFN